MKQRDLELLSSYLDGQLNPADATRLEARLLVEPDLRSVLRDLRSARTMLRQLPMRKAPRNFKLTPKMVGKNPPLPRAYPAFRFTSAIATLLLFLSFGLNFLRPQLLAAQPTGFGMGGGGAPDLYNSAPAAEMPAPVLTEMPATEAPAAESSIASAPMPTATIAAAQEDTARAMETEVAKTAATELAAAQGVPAQPIEPANTQPMVSPAWQWLLAGIAVLSVFVMALMRQLSVNRWRGK
jgi:anti-sigma factor RsiW